MKKGNVIIRYLFFIVIISIISVIAFGLINDKLDKKIFDYENPCVELEKTKLPVMKTKKALNMCYAENEVASIFSSISLFRDTYFYDLYWSFKILEQTGDIKKFKNELSDLTILSEQSIVFEKECMETISNIVELQAKLGLEISRKDEIIKELNSRFLEKEKLFYDSNKIENKKKKIYATKYAVLIIKNLGIEGKFDIEGIYKSIMNEYVNESNFSNDFNEFCFNTGNAIIDFINVHNINLDKFDSEINDKRLRLLENFNNNYMENINESYDLVSVRKLINLLEMNKCLKSKFIIEEDLINKYLNSQNFIGGFGPYYTNIDPFSTNDMLKLCTLNNMDYKNIQKLVEFIKKQISTEFRIVGDLPISMGDNYYGILLANATGFEYNKEKVREFIKLNYKSYISDSCVIDEFDKMRDIYYILLSCKEMEINIENRDKNQLAKNVKLFLDGQDYNTDEDLYSILRTFRMGLELSMICDNNLSDNYSKKIEEIINFGINNNEHENLLALYEISKVLDYTETRKDIYERIISKTIKTLYYKGGFKLYNHTEANPHIFYLAKGIYIMKYAEILSENVIFEVEAYLDDFENSKFLFSNNAPNDLRTIYQGYLANVYISECKFKK